MIVFGGADANRRPMNDLWSYSAREGRWSELQPAGTLPPPVMAHTAVWDWTGQMIVFGGLTPGASPVGLWTYAARENIWRQPTASSQPQLRVGHVATWDDARRTMLVVGGVADGGSGLDAAWMYAPDRHAWAEGVIDGEAPASTFGSRAVWDRVGQQLLLIGGWGVARGDLWTLSIPTTETTER